MKKNKNKMYLNLDLLYNVFDYMNPLLYYSNSELDIVYNKITWKIIIQIKKNNYIEWIDILKDTSYRYIKNFKLFDDLIFDYLGLTKKIVFSNKEFKLENLSAKRTKKQFKLPIPEYNFLFNNIRLTAGSFSSYESQSNINSRYYKKQYKMNFDFYGKF